MYVNVSDSGDPGCEAFISLHFDDEIKFPLLLGKGELHKNPWHRSDSNYPNTQVFKQILLFSDMNWKLLLHFLDTIIY